MPNWHEIVKSARSCNTKQAWKEFTAEHQLSLASTNVAKPLSDIFKKLKKDPQSLAYDPAIFEALIKGCLSSWNLELGQEICEFAKSITTPSFTLPAAKLYMEAGQPAAARKIAQKTLRLQKIAVKDKIQLEMLVCSSFAEGGNHKKAKQLLHKLEEDPSLQSLPQKDLADLHTEMGRVLFFMGQYHESGKFFSQASDNYINLSDWENGVKSLFNTAMCYHNAGEKREEGFVFVERAREIAETHNFAGPLSHIESFYGLDDFHHGNFSGARDHLRRSLDVIPASDKGYRRLHVISMLALTYLAQGKRHLANQLGKQTLELAALDESNKYQMRYLSLEAELLWENGEIESSQALLAKAANEIKAHGGMQTLEELSTMSRHLLQEALLNKNPSQQSTVKEELTKNPFNWLDYLYSEAQLELNRGDLVKAQKKFQEIEQKAKNDSDRFHTALSQLGQAEAMLASNILSDELRNKVRQFEVSVAQIGDTPLKTKAMILKAGIDFLAGDFSSCIRRLKIAAKNRQSSFTDSFVIGCWLETSEGRSSRLTHQWQFDLLARATRIYFAPSIQSHGKGEYTISNQHQVSLDKHPLLDELLQYLLEKPNHRATSEQIQADVWKQNLQMLGWQQKIRNTLMRLRELFPFTLAPLIIQRDDIQIFSEAITIIQGKLQSTDKNSQIIKMLQDKSMSSSDIAEHISVSPATVKRMLKKLIEDQSITSNRLGRKILYQGKK